MTATVPTSLTSKEEREEYARLRAVCFDAFIEAWEEAGRTGDLSAVGDVGNAVLAAVRGRPDHVDRTTSTRLAFEAASEANAAIMKATREAQAFCNDAMAFALRGGWGNEKLQAYLNSACRVTSRTTVRYVV